MNKWLKLGVTVVAAMYLGLIGAGSYWLSKLDEPRKEIFNAVGSYDPNRNYVDEDSHVRYDYGGKLDKLVNIRDNFAYSNFALPFGKDIVRSVTIMDDTPDKRVVNTGSFIITLDPTLVFRGPNKKALEDLAEFSK